MNIQRHLSVPLILYSNILQSVSLPKNIRTIEENVFSESSLTSITFPNTLEVIGKKAFAGTRLSNVDFFHSKVKMIDSEAFTRTQLKHITLPSTLQSLGTSCFESCALLTSVNMSKCSLYSLPSRLFEDCKELEVCILPLTLQSLNFTSFSGVEIEKLQIPGFVRTICPNAFSGMNKLSVLEYCGSYEFGPISSLRDDIKVFVRKGYEYSTFAGHKYQTCTTCPLVNSESPVDINPQQMNDSFVIMTLTVGFIALAVVIVGIMKITVPKPATNDRESLLINKSELE